MSDENDLNTGLSYDDFEKMRNAINTFGVSFSLFSENLMASCENIMKAFFDFGEALLQNPDMQKALKQIEDKNFYWPWDDETDRETSDLRVSQIAVLNEIIDGIREGTIEIISIETLSQKPFGKCDDDKILTESGIVNGIDTQTPDCLYDDDLYLSDSIPGSLQNISPPNETIIKWQTIRNIKRGYVYGFVKCN